MSEWTDAKIRWAATKIQASIRGLLQRWRDLKAITYVQLNKEMMHGKRARGNIDVRLRFKLGFDERHNREQRLIRRLRREYGGLALLNNRYAYNVTRNMYRKIMSLIVKREDWLTHRKRLGVKLLDFGS